MSAADEYAREAEEVNRAVTEHLDRAKIWADPTSPGEFIDVTEDVVSIMDIVANSMDLGSGFLDEDDLRGFNRLADLLKMDRAQVPEWSRP